MRFRFSEPEERFRREVRSFLADHRDLDGYFRQGQRWPAVKGLFQEMGARGWLSLAWPEEDGGAAGSPALEYLLWDEVAYARAARNPLSAGIVARTLIRHGTAEQKRRYLPPIRSGDLHFALGYSEPEAGSDLASLRCRAERHGEEYVVDGHKCWQSYAQDMDCLWLLCRTGEPGGRSEGLSLLIVDLDAPGVGRRDLPILDGEQLNEIRLDAVRVPVSRRVGPEGGAWKIMGEALADERHIQFPPGRVHRDVEELHAWCRNRRLDADAGVRRELSALAVVALQVEMMALRVLDAMQRGHDATALAAANKVLHTEACQRIARTALEWEGPAALLEDARPALLWRQSMWETVGGGTSEIMRGIVAKRALGLSGRA
ncbi:MAG: acyl-CoA dehydrogenase family protein [Myxococcota bacterium]|nr:acyl-CoA dehydrogenase family protein [Myxococcota bacterium]